MKRNISLAMRCVVAVFALVVVVTGAPITVSAASNSNTVMPRYNNVANVMNYFEITSDGTAYVDSSYNGTPGITTGATIEIQLQRKTLLWWSDVDGGYWYDSFTSYYGSISDSIQLTKTGKYRAVITVTVSGTGGAGDVIEDTLTYEY